MHSSEVSAAIVDQVIGSVHMILYVSDQVAATAFWQVVLDSPPALDVPGMTEFALGAQVVLGLMPETGIRSLLGPSLPDPAAAHGIPRAEVYLSLRTRLLTMPGRGRPERPNCPR